MTNWQSPKRSSVTPMIMVKDALKTIEFLKQVFGAELIGEALMRADGSLWNAEVKIGDSTIMLTCPPDGSEIPGFNYVHVPDVDAVFDKAVAAGGEPIMRPSEQFYGEYDGGFKDAQGNLWWISTHRKVLSPEEIEKGARAFEKRMAGGGQ